MDESSVVSERGYRRKSAAVMGVQVLCINRAGRLSRTFFAPSFCTAFPFTAYSRHMAAAAPREDVLEAQKREIEALKQENEALKQESKAQAREIEVLKLNATYYANNPRLQVAHDVWVFAQDVLRTLNTFHSDFVGMFFENFRALVKEKNHEAYVGRLAKYIRWIKSQFMFVRVRRPPGSKRFVLAYMKCERVFSFVPRYQRMWERLNDVPWKLLDKMETKVNKALRTACMGPTTFELSRSAQRAMQKYKKNKCPLHAALEANDEESAEALLDGGADPNEVDGSGRNALHIAALKGCGPPLFHRIVARIQNVNSGDKIGYTALMLAARYHMDVVISLMNHPGIDLNVQGGFFNRTVLHEADIKNRAAILAQLLSDEKVNFRLEGRENKTPLKLAIFLERHECVKILKAHGATE